jgi:hypothetical protein
MYSCSKSNDFKAKLYRSCAEIIEESNLHNISSTTSKFVFSRTFLSSSHSVV